jgi:hypothetical protein
MARAPRPPSSFVAEWFGHLVWPPEEVDASPEAVRNQTEERCPFLSSATARDVPCIKKAKIEGIELRTGFCTQSSPSTGTREDWLACPARVFDEPFTLIRDAVVHIFKLDGKEPFTVVPLTRFGDEAIQRLVRSLSAAGPNGRSHRVFAFASNPPTLGGEIDIPETPRSPGNKVDVSIFEIVGVDDDGQPDVGRFSIFEIQTADFHGSPLHAIAELRRLGPPARDTAYHELIAANPELLGKRLEGPNKANIFKRTIYQMILKIQMAKDPRCAGFCVVLPEPVWQSWARHLGDPELVDDPDADGILRLRVPTAESHDDETIVEPEPAWIIVFKVDRESALSPRPLKIVKRIATDSAALIHYAFDEAPEAAIAAGALQTFEATFAARLRLHWNT